MSLESALACPPPPIKKGFEWGAWCSPPLSCTYMGEARQLETLEKLALKNSQESER